jgi:Lon protease-like protein
LGFNSTGELLAALCYDEIQKKHCLEVFDAETRKRVIMPTAYSHQRNNLAWNPDALVLAVCGESEKD